MKREIKNRLITLEQQIRVHRTEHSAVDRFAKLLIEANQDPSAPESQKFIEILSAVRQWPVGDVVAEALRQKHSGKDTQIGHMAIKAVCE